jgi:hypothetical protein
LYVYIGPFINFKIRDQLKMCGSGCCSGGSGCKQSYGCKPACQPACSYVTCKPACQVVESVELVPRYEIKNTYDIITKEKVIRWNEVIPRTEVKTCGYDVKPKCSTVCEYPSCAPAYPSCPTSPCSSVSYNPTCY